MEITVDSLLEAKKVLPVFRSLCNNTRRAIILFLLQSNESTVTEVYKHFDMEQSAASAHLNSMLKQKLLIRRKEQKNCYYSVNKNNTQTILTVTKMLNEL